jgi:hypothetical protein
MVTGASQVTTPEASGNLAGIECVARAAGVHEGDALGSCSAQIAE